MPRIRIRKVQKVPDPDPQHCFWMPKESLCSAQTQTRIGLLEEIPRSGSDSLPLLLGHLGVRAPYATRRKLRYEANQVWMNTTFISQGPQSWIKLAVET